MAEYLVASGSRKISQLTYISAISSSGAGSAEYTVLPIVMGSTFPITDGSTNQIKISDFRSSVILNNANVFTANQTFNGGITVNSNLSIAGKLTANEVETIYQTSSVVFSSGSNKFGDASNDVHEFTGSVNVSGSLTLNNLTTNRVVLVGNGGTLIDSSSLQFIGGTSTLAVNGNIFVQQNANITGVVINSLIGAVTGALLNRTDLLHITSQSLNQFTASQIGVNNLVAGITASLNEFTSSQIGVNNGIAIVTSSLNLFTSSLNISVTSLNQFTSSQLGVNFGNSIVTGSINNFTSSQLGVNFQNSIVTSSLNNFTSSQLGVNFGVAVVTSSLNDFTSSQLGVNFVNSIVTSSINNFTSSQLGVNFVNSIVTGSINNFTSSQIGVNNLIAGVTASINEFTSSQIGVNNLIAGVTASINQFTSSQIGINNGISIVTGSLNVFTSSIRAEVDLIEAYTHSLKSVALVSSSQQVIDYNLFALTGSSNTFYATQAISGNLALVGTNPLVYNNTSSNAMLVGFFDGGTIYGPYLQMFGKDYPSAQKGGAEIVYDIRNGSDGNFHVASFNGSTWIEKLRVDDNTTHITGSLNVSSSLTASLREGYLWVGGPNNITKVTDTASMTVGTASFSQYATDLYVTAKNSTGNQLNKGTIVHIIGAVGDNPLIQTASWENDNNSANTLGMLDANILNGESGKVILYGTILGVNTNGYAAGDILYLSSSGQYTNIQPQAPKHTVSIGQVLRVHPSVGSISIKIQNGYEIQELHDVRVNTASLADNQLLARSGSVWRNISITDLGIAITGSNVFTATQTITGSLFVSSSIRVNELVRLAPLATLPTGEAGMLIASSSYGVTNLYMYDGSEWKWLVTGSIA